MQQRRPRLGDILDDYCPRERRITNHAVVAMIEDQIKQTRCTTCNADHDYKQAKAPVPRRPKTVGALANEGDGASAPRPVLASGFPALDEAPESPESPEAAVESFDTLGASEATEAAPPEPDPVEDEGPVHRRLIRATLPRPEGQVPERKEPDFTIRQPGGRGRDFDANRNGHRQRGHRPETQNQGNPGNQTPSRFGGPRYGSGQGRPDGDRQGNRPGPSGQRGGRPPNGQGRGQRQGSGPGRKRGR